MQAALLASIYASIDCSVATCSNKYICQYIMHIHARPHSTTKLDPTPELLQAKQHLQVLYTRRMLVLQILRTKCVQCQIAVPAWQVV